MGCEPNHLLDLFTYMVLLHMKTLCPLEVPITVR